MSNRLPVKEFEEAESSRLVGTIQEVIYHSPESGFIVARFALEGEKGDLSIVGNLVKPVVGERLALEGRWSEHAKYGRQFSFHHYESLPLDSAAAMEQYLASGLLKGVGPVTARRLVEQFGGDLERILDEEPERVKEIRGLGGKKWRSVAESWQKQRQARHLVLFLQEHGISANLAARIFSSLGERALATIRKNPYALTSEVWGVGFRTADRMARSLGLAPDSKERLRAALNYSLQRGVSFGHVFLPESSLLQSAAEVLTTREGGWESQSPAGLIEDRTESSEARGCEAGEDGSESTASTSQPRFTVLESELGCMEEEKEVMREGFPFMEEKAVYLASLHGMEVSVAARLARLVSVPLQKTRATAAREPSGGAMEALTRGQREAVECALTSKVTIITGGPGVGKTTCLRALVGLLEMCGARVELASPTGRAAKRLAEVSGARASTLHRLLGFDPFTSRCGYNARNRLPCDAVIVDEASMLDLWLAEQLLQALPDEAQLILVGDSDQLPAVGPGNVLVDMIRSGKVPVRRLSEVFRQAQQSLIITNAHRINRGEMPQLVPWKDRDGKDCLFIWEEDPAAIEGMVARLASEALPALGYNPAQIQVITPMHKGEIGTTNLNRALQAVLNPGRGGHAGRLREGDRVMQTVNNYEKGVFNGDIGYVTLVGSGGGGLEVEFSEQRVSYAPEELDQLQLAYALTAHKSQGSEYPATIIVLHPSHYIMLQRNLLYTALTRAMRLAVLVGTPDAIRMAVGNDRQVRRYTALAERIVRGLEPGRVS